MVQLGPVATLQDTFAKYGSTGALSTLAAATAADLFVMLSASSPLSS